MPQDVRISPDANHFYVADMETDGVHVVDAESFPELRLTAAAMRPGGWHDSSGTQHVF